MICLQKKTAIGLYDRDAALSAYHDILSDTDDQAAITALRGLATIANNYGTVLEDTIRRARTVTDYDEWLKHHVTEAVLPSLELCCSALRYLRTIDCRNTLPPAGSNGTCTGNRLI